MNKKNIIRFQHQQMYLEYIKKEKKFGQIAFSPKLERNEIYEAIPFPNFQIGISGRLFGFESQFNSAYCKLAEEMDFISQESNEKIIWFTYMHKTLDLIVTIKMNLIPDVNMIRQYTSVENVGDKPVLLNHLSSFSMQGIATHGVRKWNDKDKIKVYYCRQTWGGEGQWYSCNPDEMGLYRTTARTICKSAIHLASIGSCSTSRYLPMLVLEDIETGYVWYCQVETSSNWHIEVGFRGTWEENIGGLYIKADGADERHGGWTHLLQPGETFTSVPAAVGCCRGNFTDAIWEFTKYRRRHLKIKNAWEGDYPIIFNDYMNCLWANPTWENEIPLIDAVSKLGIDYYCIDSGWFGDIGTPWTIGLGDWLPSKSRFRNHGLQGLLDYIKEKGLKPGIWLEMEVCGKDSVIGKKPDSWFLMRNGLRVGGGNRWFLNFVNPDVRAHMHGVIDRLVCMGICFIKNDYNDCIGNGDDTLGTSASDGLIKHMNAFYAFIDEVRERHPNLILENCGSGAMRQDYGILSHFHMQSTSDQECYYQYPSIITGALAGLLPEQAGIWAYPIPLALANKDTPEVLKSKTYHELMSDGEQTIFNMVNGMCGNLYLSGRIDFADDKNFSLIKEAIALYRSERGHIHSAYPIWPLGFTKLNDLESWASMGLVNEKKTRILLAVWRLDSAKDCYEFPLYQWAGEKASVKLLYPKQDKTTQYSYNQHKGTLTVFLPKMRCARFFEVKFY